MGKEDSPSSVASLDRGQWCLSHNHQYSGFPGGFSVARLPIECLVRVYNEEVDARQCLGICKGKLTCCPGDQPMSKLATEITSSKLNDQDLRRLECT